MMKHLRIMKGLLLAGCVALGGWACTDRRPAGDATAGAKPAGTVAFRGSWANKKYVQALRQSKSPRQAQGAAELSVVVIPGVAGGKASLVWGFHEGTEYVLSTEADGKAGLHDAEGGNRAYELQYAPAGDSLKVGNDWFVRLADGNGPDRVANEYLFAGQYRAGDREVTFFPDGKVTGLDSIRYYQPVLDYIDAGMDVDQVLLGRAAETTKPYGFAIRGNALIVYRLTCVEFDSTSQHCGVVENGPELLRLEKQFRP
jgi:hypothetical protein